MVPTARTQVADGAHKCNQRVWGNFPARPPAGPGPEEGVISRISVSPKTRVVWTLPAKVIKLSSLVATKKPASSCTKHGGILTGLGGITGPAGRVEGEGTQGSVVSKRGRSSGSAREGDEEFPRSRGNSWEDSTWFEPSQVRPLPWHHQMVVVGLEQSSKLVLVVALQLTIRHLSRNHWSMKELALQDARAQVTFVVCIPKRLPKQGDDCLLNS